MSFYIRKSVKFGPIRFNFSKSGIGISIGVRGARVSTGPRGTFVHLGSNGLYYRQKIGGSAASTPSESPVGSPHGTGSRIDTASVDGLVELSNKDMLDQINSRIRRPSFAWVVGVVSTVIASVIASLAGTIQSNASTIPGNAYSVILLFPLVVAGVVWILGMWTTWVTSQQDKSARTTTLRYKLDSGAKEKFIALQNALGNLAKSTCVWHVVSQAPNWDWKRNAGATSIITRKQIRVVRTLPTFIRTKFKVYGLSLGTMQLFFMPDQVLVFQNRKYGGVTYNALQVYASPTRFIEDESIPRDSGVIDYTWQYVRKDGGPDMRFKNNRRIPIAEYGYVELSSQSGLSLRIHVSNLSYAQEFARALLDYVRHCQGRRTASSNRTSSRHRYGTQTRTEARRKPESENPYAILNVSPTASQDEITAAYRKLAQMYHPDKVAGLAPEFQELAEKRMKAINAAYEQLKRSFHN